MSKITYRSIWLGIVELLKPARVPTKWLLFVDGFNTISFYCMLVVGICGNRISELNYYYWILTSMWRPIPYLASWSLPRDLGSNLFISKTMHFMEFQYIENFMHHHLVRMPFRYNNLHLLFEVHLTNWLHSNPPLCSNSPFLVSFIK